MTKTIAASTRILRATLLTLAIAATHVGPTAVASNAACPAFGVAVDLAKIASYQPRLILPGPDNPRAQVHAAQEFLKNDQLIQELFALGYRSGDGTMQAALAAVFRGLAEAISVSHDRNWDFGEGVRDGEIVFGRNGKYVRITPRGAVYKSDLFDSRPEKRRELIREAPLDPPAPPFDPAKVQSLKFGRIFGDLREAKGLVRAATEYLKGDALNQDLFILGFRSFDGSLQAALAGAFEVLGAEILKRRKGQWGFVFHQQGDDFVYFGDSLNQFVFTRGGDIWKSSSSHPELRLIRRNSPEPEP